VRLGTRRQGLPLTVTVTPYVLRMMNLPSGHGPQRPRLFQSSLVKPARGRGIHVAGVEYFRIFGDEGTRNVGFH
jgi:hypothetical protein